MKKKFKTLLIIIIIVIGLSAAGIISKFILSRMKKGYEVYGVEHCQGHQYDIAYPAHREYKCNICEKDKETETIPIPEICSTCSKMTRRCPKCGKIVD